MNEPAVGYVDGRSCEGCTMCCKLLSIAALDKPRLQWCTHCDIGVGCKIYEERPTECRIFACGYLTQARIGEHWRPANSKMVISLLPSVNRMVVYVDPDRSDTWRKEPYYSDIKNWARAAAKNQGQLLVSQGRDMIAVMPDGETNLGPVTDDQLIITRRKRGSGGTGIEYVIVDQDDPIRAPVRSSDAARSAPVRAESWLAAALPRAPSPKLQP